MSKVCQICGCQLNTSFRKTVCDDCGSGYLMGKIKATYLLGRAIKSGKLIRLEYCELCGNKPLQSPIKTSTGKYRTAIVGHHYNGHNNPLDVWFLCFLCNIRLPGPQWHSGTKTKQQAIDYLQRFQPSAAAMIMEDTNDNQYKHKSF